MIKDDFKNAVAYERKRLGISKASMASFFNSSSDIVAGWESGKRAPHNYLFDEFCLRYGYVISIDNQTMEFKDLTEWINRKRIEQNLSKEKLSLKAGLKERYFSNIKPWKGIGVNRVDLILKALGYEGYLVKEKKQ